MKDSHRDLMITATEWDAFLDDLQQTLDKFAVPQAEQAEIKAIIDSTRADIVYVGWGAYLPLMVHSGDRPHSE
jgi:hemoglobin